MHVYHAVKDQEKDCLRWGDEIEYHLMHFDAPSKTVKLPLIAAAVIEQLEKEDAEAAAPRLASWHPEYGAWMVEGKTYCTVWSTGEGGGAHARGRGPHDVCGRRSHTRFPVR